MKMQNNQYFEAKCVDLSHDGQGVVKVDGFTYFVKGMLVNEYGKLKVIKVLKNYGIARLIEVIEASQYRVVPKCPVFKACGGCQLQHLHIDGQKVFKTNRVRETLRRIGEVDIDVAETLMMDNPWYYRNKSQLPVGVGKDGSLITGFYKKHSNDIIAQDECFIQNCPSNLLVNKVREILSEYGITAYNNKDGKKGLLRHILVKYGYYTKQLMLVLITNGNKLPNERKIIDRIVNCFPDITTIVQNINKKSNNVILGDEEKILFGNGYIEDLLGDFKFRISSKSFYQINPIQTEVLYQKVLELADLKGKETVIDAYCGIGSISLFLGKQAKRVYAVEINEQAITDAKINAEINNINNVDFFVDDAGEFMIKLSQESKNIDVVVVDPPRKGCSQDFLDALVLLNPSKVVYVSCDVSTQARDLKYLKERGYEAMICQPVDMFPQTTHVETVVLLSHKKIEEHVKLFYEPE